MFGWMYPYNGDPVKFTEGGMRKLRNIEQMIVLMVGIG